MADSAPQGGGRDVIQPGTVNAPEFPAGLHWLNTEQPLTIRQLRGKIVLLDFWTFCCINCLHALEDLKRLEQKYPEELVVIGVHSAKFDEEKNTSAIREAVLRHGIEHPVVNDSEMQVWQAYSVRAWPSFMLIDPRGKVFGTHSGERVFDLFDRVISMMIEHYESLGELRSGLLATRSEADRAPDSVLSYPGKVLADSGGRRLFIADTSHHRIVVADLDDGTVLDVIGNGEQGLVDGSSRSARFSFPQGMALSGSSLFVADTGNHAIRIVDLENGAVSTVAGDGQQDMEWNNAPGPLAGRRLNSPWDLHLAHGVLFVAMAGNHQIFGIDLAGGYIAGHAGSGREDHVDGPLLAAALAQPSGITSDGQNLFVADSEVSSIRAVSLDPRGGHVRTVVGKGLFDFGDVDGAGQDARLQHPLGVAFAEGTLYVADTYNHKIKTIALPKPAARTFAGSGRPGCRDGARDTAMFDEPSGLSFADGRLFVADTNNHAIRAVDVATGTVSTWPLRRMDKLLPAVGTARFMPPTRVRPGKVRFLVEYKLPDGHEFSTAATSDLTLHAHDGEFAVPLRDGEAEVFLDISDDHLLQMEAKVYYCGESSPGSCLYAQVAAAIPLRVDASGPPSVRMRLDTLTAPG